MNLSRESVIRKIDSLAKELSTLREELCGETVATDETFFEKKEVARQLNVYYRTINRWISEGLLSTQIIGKRHRISGRELKRFMMENSNGSDGLKRVEQPAISSIMQLRDKYKQCMRSI